MSGRNGKAERGSGAATKVGVVHRLGESIVLLVGEPIGGSLSISARTLTESEWATTKTGLYATGVGRIVHVVAGGETICRLAPVPQGDPVQMASAAALLAEAQLPESIPGHRKGAGVLSGQGEGATVPALLVAWRPGTGEPLGLEGIEEAWCPAIGALGALRGSGAEAAWFADPADGSICVLTGNGEAATARVVIEDNSSAVLWGEGVEATIGESLEDGEMRARIGLGKDSVAACSDAVSGAHIDQRWLNSYGIALGAMLAATADGPLLRGLARLTAKAPRVQEAAVLRAATWLGEGRRAWWVAAAAIVVLVVAPLGFARARLAILESKSKSLAAAKDQRKELDKRAAVYKELAATRWPMTKLLADISRAAPEHVVLRDLRIQPEVGLSSGGTDQGITLQGTADTQERVYDLQTNLNKTGLFRGVRVSRAENKGDGNVEFDLTMGVANPHGAIPAVDGWDWAKKNLASRLYGEGADNKTAPINRNGSAASEDRPTRRTSRGGEDEPQEKGARKTAEKKDAGGLPAALTDDQIAKMDRSSAMREMASRRKYSQQNPSLDAATKRRLDDEVVKLRERMDVLRTAGGKAGA